MYFILCMCLSIQFEPMIDLYHVYGLTFACGISMASTVKIIVTKNKAVTQ